MSDFAPELNLLRARAMELELALEEARKELVIGSAFSGRGDPGQDIASYPGLSSRMAAAAANAQSVLSNPPSAQVTIELVTEDGMGSQFVEPERVEVQDDGTVTYVVKAWASRFQHLWNKVVNFPLNAELLATGRVYGTPQGPADELKMWLIVRRDLNMPIEKGYPQAGHGYLTCYAITRELNPEVAISYVNSSQAKISVGVKSEDELLKAFEACREAGLVACLVKDAARTVFNEETYTVACVGPCKRDELPKRVKKLQLLKSDHWAIAADQILTQT